VSAGKTLRIMAISVDTTGSTAGNVKLMVRSAVPVLGIASPLFYRCQTGVTASAGMDHKEVTFPEGLEIASGQAVGVSQIASVTTVTSTFTMNGFEY
jgi:hypothetical protein